MRAWTILSLETWSRMPRYTIRTDAARDPESLEDLVYRPRLATDNRHVRSANPLIAVPVTLLGYFVLGLLVWQLVQQSKSLLTETPKTVAVDLLDASEGEAPQAPAPLPAAGGPPPGAIVKADVPPPPMPANSDVAPEKPPTELPTQDLSGTAFPAQPAGGTSSTGSGPGAGGTGEGTGTGAAGSGQAVKVVDYDFQQIKVLFLPPPPPYPQLAKSAHVQGTVKVELIVGIDGVPVSVRAVEGPMMLRATSEAYAARMRFRPETENGVPVYARFLLTMPYTLK